MSPRCAGGSPFLARRAVDEAACHASRLQAYGEHTVAVERDLEHAELYFGILAARDGEVVRLLTSVA